MVLDYTRERAAFVEPERLDLILRRHPSPLPRANADGFLPVLLIVAVLLCDGILGFTHQVSCDACGPEVSGMHHGSTTGMGEAGSGHTGNDGALGGVENHSYAAIVPAAISTALLVLLLGVRSWREASAPRSIFRPHYSPFVTPRPRGPTLPSLQVLRL